MEVQDRDFDYFIDHHDEIYARYPDSFVVISNKQIINTAKSFEEALVRALNDGLEPGTFNIQECSKDKNTYTQKFRSRAIFK